MKFTYGQPFLCPVPESTWENWASLDGRNITLNTPLPEHIRAAWTFIPVGKFSSHGIAGGWHWTLFSDSTHGEVTDSQFSPPDTFDDWWERNITTPEMMGSLHEWARVMYEAAYQAGYDAGFEAGRKRD